MSVQEPIVKLFQRAVDRARLIGLEHGKLGKKVTGGATLIYKRGQVGVVYVTRRDQTVIEARVKGSIEYTAGYPVEFREEHGGYVIYGKSVHPSLPPVEEAPPPPSGAETFVELTDVPATYVGQAGKIPAVKVTEDGLEFIAPPAGGAEAFTELTDAPSTYGGQAGKLPAVNATEDGLEFIAPPSGGAEAFTDLTDVPSAYLGEAGKVATVNATEDGLVFETPSVDPGFVGGIGTMLEWLYVGGGDQVDYNNNYVGYVHPDDAALGSGGWGGIVVEPNPDYIYSYAIIDGVPGVSQDHVMGLWEKGIIFFARDYGSGEGPAVNLRRNNNAATPAAAHIALDRRDGNTRKIWIDVTGMVRVSTASLTINNANDSGGTVIGTQTSSLDAKDLIGKPISPAEALIYIMATAKEAIKRFQYKVASDSKEEARPFNGEEFQGIITDLAPRYGMDRDKDHPHGKSLNVVNAIGDLMLAVTGLAERVEALEAENQLLKGRKGK